MKRMLVVMASVLMLGALCGAAPQPSAAPQAIHGHPRLLMHADEFEALRARIASGGNETLIELHRQVMRRAEMLAGEDYTPVFKLDAAGKRLLHVSRHVLYRVFSFAYAYRMTGEERYLELAQADMLAACSFHTWNPSHFLDVAEMGTAVSIGYDWLYDDLREETRHKVREALETMVIEPALELKYKRGFYSSIGNWNQVCNCGTVLAALSLYEQDPARYQEIIERSIETDKEVGEKIYAPDGSYPEGYAYWNYGTSFQVMMMACLESAQGTDYGIGETSGMDNTGAWMMFMEGPGGKAYNYSDGGSDIALLWPQWYFARKYSHPDLLYGEISKISLLDSGYLTNEGIRLIPLVMALASKLETVQAKAPTRHVWAGQGVTPQVLVRTGWTGGLEDKYLGIKGGKASSNHSHMDAGSFVFDAEGVRWATDLGGVGPYAAAENAMRARGLSLWDMDQDSGRWTFMKHNNRFHNTLTINDSDHRVDGKAELVRVIDRRSRKGGCFDLTPPLSGQLASAVRTATIVRDSYLEVKDEVRALPDKEAVVRWTLVTEADVKVLDDCIVLSINGHSRTLRVKAGVPVSLRQFSSEPWHDYDVGMSGVRAVGFEATVPAGRAETFRVTLKKK